MISKYQKIIFFSFLLLSILTKAFGENKIVYLDLEFVLSKTNVGKKVLQNLSISEKNKEKEFNDKEKKLKDDENKILASKNIISEEQLMINTKDFQKKLRDYRNYKSDELNKLSKKRKEDIMNLINLINPIIEEYIKNNSISIVIDKKNIYIADENYDISDNLIELINKKIK